MLLRVVTYNIQDGGLGREAQLLEILTALRPDVVLLQEVFAASPLADWAQALGLEFVRAPSNTHRQQALLSRLPIQSFTSFRPRPPIHTCLLEAALSFASGRTLHVYGLHLLAQPFIAMEFWRWWEMTVILRRSEVARSGLCLLAGDFNAVAPGDQPRVARWPRRLKLLLAAQGSLLFRRVLSQARSAGLADCFRTLHPTDSGFTLPSHAPNTRLDYLLASSQLRPFLQKCFVATEPAAVRLASDHLPLIADFDFPPS
jgi:endonuclease/exonuclease/phosphatase family metal-dependent hydrolase